MAQSYADVLAQQKEIGTAKVLNPNYDLQVRQEQNRTDQVNQQAKDKAIQEYIAQKVSEGYVLGSDGTLTKETKKKSGKRKGKQLYTITVTTLDVNKVSGEVTTKTQTQDTKSGSSNDPLVSKANKLERAIEDIYSGKSGASASTLAQLKRQLNETYELIKNRKGNQSFVTVPETVDSGTVFDIKGQGYSVAPALQEKFLEEKNQSVSQVIQSPAVRSGFTVPRIVSSQETQSVPLSVDTSKLPTVKTQSFGGVVQASRVGDFAVKYDAQTGDRLTPTPADLTEYKVRRFIDNVGLQNNPLSELYINPFLKVKDVPIVAGAVVSGLLSPAKLGVTVYQASPFNPVDINREATQSKIKQGIVAVLKDPFTKLVAELLQTVVENPLYEVPKIATELVLLESATRGAKVVVRGVGAVNKFSKTDVRVSTIENTPSLLNPLEKKSYFIDEGSQLKGNTPFELNLRDTRLQQKTLVGKSAVDVQSQFIIREKVPAVKEQQLTLNGQKTFGRTFRDEDFVQVKDSTESVQQSINVVDEIVIDDLGQISSAKTVKLTPVTDKTVLEATTKKSTEYYTTKDGTIAVDTLSEGVGRNQEMFNIKPMQEYNGQLVILEEQSRGKIITIPKDVQLGSDIQGKVTPQKSGVNILPLILSDSKSAVMQTPALDLQSAQDLKSSLDTVPVSDQTLGSKNLYVQVPESKQVQGSVQLLKQSSVSQLDLKQKQVQKLQPMLKLETVERVEVKPLLPKVRTERQVKSGAGLFDVLVRKEGKFVKVGSGYSDLATAFNRGKQEIKNTARASFKVVSRFGEPQKLNLDADRTLRLSKRDANVVVQKREFRISSEGEKTEISRKGVFVQRTRRGLRRAVKKGIFV